MSISSEFGAVQSPMIEFAVAAGWVHVTASDAVRLRGGTSSPLMVGTLVRQLQKLNARSVDHAMAEQVAADLRRIRPSIEGNRDAWQYLRGERTAFSAVDSREYDVILVDFDDIDRNIFQVTEEFRFSNENSQIRQDVVFLVNGVPILVVEAKAATVRGGIAKALKQLRRYHDECPELLAIEQLQSFNQLVQIQYSATWSLNRRNLISWREGQDDRTYEDLIKDFVSPRHVLTLLRDAILFNTVDGRLSKVLLRPHQVRAVNKVVERATDKHKKRGLIWHTQGSGKTFTMICAVQRIVADPAFDDPTVLLLVDRNELEAQLFGNFESVGVTNVKLAESKKDLQEVLRSDYRGILISTIHKFDDMPSGIVTRSNMIVLVDEAHRSTGGGLGTYLMAALPSATIVGFTGTPIDLSAHGQGTFKVFGSDDSAGYLDKYSIRESLEDKTTLPLHYSIAPNELRVERDVLEREFLSLAEAEGISEVEELDKVLNRAVTLKNMLKNRDRIDRIASWVAGHFRSNVRPAGYKGFLVAVDREACCWYKKALDRYLEPRSSRVIISEGEDDTDEVKSFHLSREEERKARDDFRAPDNDLEILIVTQKLLTGFDAPIMETMYLDKPMRDHVLLQAIARVNRPLEDGQRRKSSGVIIDFVGTFERLEDALAFDSRDLVDALDDLAVLRDHWTQLMSTARETYLAAIKDKRAAEAVDFLLNEYRSAEQRELLYTHYREMEDIYEVLSPDEFLRSDVDDFAELSSVYRLLRVAFDTGTGLDGDFLQKTAALVTEQTYSGRIVDPAKVFELDSGVVGVLASQDQSDTVKVFNLVKRIQKEVQRKGGEAPHLVPIGERAESIVQGFQDRQLGTQAALEQLSSLIAEFTQADEARKRSALGTEAFATFWLLNREGLTGADAVAGSMERVFGSNPHWRDAPAQERQVRVALYRLLIDAGVEDESLSRFVEAVLALLKHGSGREGNGE